MKEVALIIPGGYVVTPAPTPYTPRYSNLGDFTSGLLNVGFYIAGVLLLFWGFWGIFQYIFSGGNKERLNFARKRIIFAFVGFFIVAMSFAISQYVQGIFPYSVGTSITPLSSPTSLPPP